MRQLLESPSLLWGLVLILGLILLAGLTLFVKRKREHAWKRLARKLHLKFRLDEAGPVISGRLRNGFSVELRESPDSSDTGGGVILAQLTVFVPGIPNEMSAQSATGLIGDLTNLEQHVLLGDEQFDRNVHLQGVDTEELRRYWIDVRRGAFLRLIQEFPDDRILLADGKLIAERRGLNHDVETLRHWLRGLMIAAENLTSPDLRPVPR